MAKIFTFASFEARRAHKAKLATNPDGERFIEECRRKWREVDARHQIERRREMWMEREAEKAIAAYCHRYGRNKALGLWNEIRTTLLEQAIEPEKDWA